MDAAVASPRAASTAHIQTNTMLLSNSGSRVVILDSSFSCRKARCPNSGLKGSSGTKSRCLALRAPVERQCEASCSLVGYDLLALSRCPDRSGLLMLDRGAQIAAMSCAACTCFFFQLLSGRLGQAVLPRLVRPGR